MSKKSNRSKAPIGTAATNAPGMSETNAVAVVLDAAATPPGLSDPGGTNTPASSGVAAGGASAEPVKPQDQDGTSTPGTVTDATNSQSAPEAEAAASGDPKSYSEPSQGDAESGAGDPAGPADATIERASIGDLVVAASAGDALLFSEGGFVGSEASASDIAIGIDLARHSDVGVISWGDKFAALSDTHPHTYAFFARLLEEPDAVPTALFVTSKTNGFRRGGVAHSAEGITFQPGDYTAEQLEAWLAEPELTVEIV